LLGRPIVVLPPKYIEGETAVKRLDTGGQAPPPPAPAADVEIRTKNPDGSLSAVLADQQFQVQGAN